MITNESSDSEEGQKTVNELEESKKSLPQDQLRITEEAKESLQENLGKAEQTTVQPEPKTKSKKENKKNQSSSSKKQTKTPSKPAPKKLSNGERSLEVIEAANTFIESSDPRNGSKKADAMQMESTNQVSGLKVDLMQPPQTDPTFYEEQQNHAENGNDPDFVEPGLKKKVKVSKTTFIPAIPAPTRTLRARDPNSRIKYAVNL